MVERRGLAVDKYELKVSLDEIDSLIAERRFADAADIADTIDWTRVKGVHVLCRISDLYKINKRYKDSRDLMEMAYERNPSGRKIIYSLCELELKLNNYIHALQLYNAFINVAPRDPDRFLLQYKLYKKQDVNVYEQIAVLEEFLQRDFRERWAYELAVLYQRAGEEQRCISQCDEIVAYFGDGRFVIRALELKKSMTPLTPQQEERLEILRSGGTIEPPVPVQEDSEESGSEAESAEESGPEQEEAENAGEAGPVSEKEEPEETGTGFEKKDTEEPDSAAVEKAADPEDNASGGKKEKAGFDDEEPEEDADASEPSATPEEYTDVLLRDARMEETIARGMRELGDGDYDSVLAQETSGQFAMVMEEDSPDETQIEGQLDLAQIMSEWEKIRKDSEQQRLAEARRRVMERSETVKRELYGDDYTESGTSDGASVPADPAGESTSEPGRTGTTRSWKKEDVEKGLRTKKKS